jgi:hypothetical protein
VKLNSSRHGQNNPNTNVSTSINKGYKEDNILNESIDDGEIKK